MLDQDQIDRLFDQDLYGSDGDRIGKVKQVYADDDSGSPKWLTVSTGLFGTKETFVPLTDADIRDGRATVPYTKDLVKDAPNVDADGHLSPDEERELYAYYGRTDYERAGDVGDDRTDYERTGDTSDRTDYERTGDVGDDRAGAPIAGGVGAGRDRDVSTRDRDADHRANRGDDDSMTVSEERLDVGTERRETGRARLRKYVVTEHVTQTVPVQREEVRLEREPITDANAGDATSGQDISEAEHEVVLHEERPVVDKETVPVERVRLGTETVTDEETVSEDVRKERVDVEGDQPDVGDSTRDR